MASSLRSPTPTLLRSFPFHPLSCLPSRLSSSKKPRRSTAFRWKKPKEELSLRCSRSRSEARVVSAVRCSSTEEGREVSVEEEPERPPFDLNLAVVLAGFAFEAYTTPPKDVGWREIDAADCQTVFLSEVFLREIYDGQLSIKLKKGFDFPAMDPWGTSDPYVVIQLEGQVAKSKIKWATKEPTWNEDFTLNIKMTPGKILQVAAWDANLLAPHKRIGYAGVDLESLCDGNWHEVVVELEGIGGGGKIYLEVRYKSYDEIEEEKQWWRIPFVSDFLMRSPLGSETVYARQFVESAFGQLKLFNYTYLKQLPTNSEGEDAEGSGKSLNSVAGLKQFVNQEKNQENSVQNLSTWEENVVSVPFEETNGNCSSLERKFDESLPPDEYFWKNFADVINQTVLQKLGFSLPGNIGWDGFDFLSKVSIQSQKIAEEKYVESGLVAPKSKNDRDIKSDKSSKHDHDIKSDKSLSTDKKLPSLLDIRKASWDVQSQIETILGALMVLTSTISQQKQESPLAVEEESKKDAVTTEADSNREYSMDETDVVAIDKLALDTRKAEEMRELFSNAESAMEAWAMLATSLGRTSFIKSEFQKICFLDNASTDTQVAIWRDTQRRRLVVAFRGTEQAKWKDLLTDIMLVPTGLNPERICGDFKQEVQVHSGFLSAYDSVRNRIMTVIKVSIGSFAKGAMESLSKWHVYVTGHSLGGALATLLALELSASQMAKSGAISVTMYNFGSPRVGNKRFAEVYNQVHDSLFWLLRCGDFTFLKKVKDSWRVVNHRDIIPTVPRLMGYCHVAQPVYLAAGDLREYLANMDVSEDGYQADVIGEATPDVLFSEFMKGEKQLVEKILQTEINLLRSIRDGTALMQHMEDFYYITLLESVRSNYRRVDSPRPNEYFSTSM